MIQKDTDLRKLTARQVRVINVLMTAKDRSEAAKVAGISRKTLYKYLRQDSFKDELSKRKNELLEVLSCDLISLLNRAVETLADLLESKQENTRRLAAVNILDHAVRLQETTDLEQRISTLEEIINES